MASAKFAKSTVNQSHAAIWASNPKLPALPASVRNIRTVVSTAPTSTTNITGFFASVTGFSLTNESMMARRTMGGSNSGRARLPRERPIAVESDGSGGASIDLTGSCNSVGIEISLQHQVLDDGAQG